MDNQVLKQLSPVAEVINVSELKQDKNDRNFKVLRLQGLTETEEIIGGKKYTIKGRGKKVSLTQWERSYLNQEPEPFFDADKGDMLAVEIWTAQTEPYDITDDETGEVREVSSYTFPVIRGDNPVTVLENAGRQLLGGADAMAEAHEAHTPAEEEVEPTITA